VRGSNQQRSQFNVAWPASSIRVQKAARLAQANALPAEGFEVC
jgi:hypothetical protein